MRQYQVNGRKVWLLTINELSKLVGLKTKTIRKYEKNGTFPRPAITDKMRSPLAGSCERRLYTEGQARAILAWVEKVNPRKGVALKEVHKQMLHEAFDEATREFYTSVGM